MASWFAKRGFSFNAMRGRKAKRIASSFLNVVVFTLIAVLALSGCSQNGSAPGGAADSASSPAEDEPSKWLRVARYKDFESTWCDDWTTYEYSDEGLLLREYEVEGRTDDFPDANLVITYGYDDFGECDERIVVPMDSKNGFSYQGQRIGAYDSEGRPCERIDVSGDETGEQRSVSFTWEYDSSDVDQLPGYTAYNEDGSFNSRVTREYDDSGNKIFEQTYVDDENYSTYEYEYDGEGNKTLERYENILRGRQQDSYEGCYKYDDAGNLVYTGKIGCAPSGSYYAYDESGNRIQEITVSGGAVIKNTVRVFNQDNLLLMELTCSKSEGFNGAYVPWSVTTYEYADIQSGQIVSGYRYCRDKFYSGLAVDYPNNTESLIDIAAVCEDLFGEDVSYLRERYDYAPGGDGLVFDEAISTELDTTILPDRIVRYLSAGDCGLNRTGFPFELDGKGWDERKRSVDQGTLEDKSVMAPEGTYDVQTNHFAFNLPDAWREKVDVELVDADGDYPVAIITLKDADCPPVLSVRVQDSSEELLGGDMASSVFERREIPNGKSIEFSTCYYLAMLMDAQEYGADSPFSLTNDQYEDVFEMTLGEFVALDAIPREQANEIKLASFDKQTEHLRSEVVDKVIVNNLV